MSFVSELKDKVKNINRKLKIILIDGDDSRAIKAAEKIKEFQNLELFLLVEKETSRNDLNFININNEKELKEKLAQKYYALREENAIKKGKENKESLEICRKLVDSRPFFAMMMLAENQVDGVVGGLNYSTSDILRAAFKAIGPKKGIKTISSVMIMHKENEETCFFSDISVNPEPNKEALVDIAYNASEFVKSLNIEPKLAFLSFSTNYSAKTPQSELIHEATKEFKNKYSNVKAIGEVQLDAALDLKVRESKYKKPYYPEKSNTFIFPDLNAGNIGYKLVQRFAQYGAIGPIVVGTKLPVNDLSRGSKVDDVINTILITALQTNK